MNFKLMAWIILIIQCMLIALGIKQISEGNMFLGGFNITLNIFFGIINLKTIVS